MSDVLMQILDLARWAPSGDNTQPWRFEIVAGDHIAVHGSDTRDWCVYDFDGHASHMAHGALLETLRIAATAFGLRAGWSLREGCPDSAPIYDVRLIADADLAVDPLNAYIEKRTVQRRPMRVTRLTEQSKSALEQAVGDYYQLGFFETLPRRLKVAGLLWDSAYIRLTCPEAYAVHRDVIEWNARFSHDRIPEQAVGVDPVTAKLMHWVLQSWKRVVFFNTFLMGTILPRIQLDFVPAIACSAHVLMRPRRAPSSLQEHAEAGMALQRLWLTATSVGLHLQPEMTPIIFRWYAQARRPLSSSPRINLQVRRLASKLDVLLGVSGTEPAAFFCRVGFSRPPASRSLRKSLMSLMRA
jgi:hypothetical protein